MLDLKALGPAVAAMLRDNMGLKVGESLLVLADVPSADELARLDFEATEDFLDRIILARGVAAISAEAFPGTRIEFLPYPSVGQHGTEVPRAVAAKMKAASVVVAMTTYSLTHTRATAEAAGTGARIASMPGILARMFMPSGPMAVDYAAVRKETRFLAELMTRTKLVRVTSPGGTDLTFSLEGRKGGADDGFLNVPGTWGNLPAGEAFVAPVEGTAEGRLVVQKGWYPGLLEDLTFVFKGGLVAAVTGGGEVGRWFAEKLNLGTADGPERSRRNCAELGIGTNPNAKTPDNVLEAEKIRGTIHIAIGDSSHMGGLTESDLHEDFVIPKPDVYFDGEKVIAGGRSLA